MRAEVKRFHSPDLDDLESYKPSDPEKFGFLLQVMVGPVGGEGEESFDIEVCTPAWLKDNYGDDEIVMGRHRLIMFRYNFQVLARWIRKYVSSCTGESWREIANKVRELGAWEFDGYDSR